MEFAKDHVKILIAVLVVAIGVSSVMVLDAGPRFSSTPAEMVASPTPGSTTSEGTVEGQVKANTFIPSFPPTKPVTQVVNPTGCSTVAIDLVLDTSNSMKRPEDNPRIDSMKEAVRDFIDQIPDEAVFTAQRFDKQARNVVSPVIMKEGRGEAQEQIAELKAAGEGGTHTREGLYRAKRMIDEANTMFPGRQWTLILLSDGAPNPKSQEGTEPASTLKDMGVKIITIGLDLDEEENVTPEEAREHMRDMASSPSDFIDANSEDLSVVYDSLTEKLCP